MNNPNITLEQARTLDAFDRHGTFAAAANALRKGHTAVLYSLRSLEDQTGLVLLDRTKYRTTLTAAGTRVLDHCRRLLDAERALVDACNEIRTGWEPVLRIVIDGILSVEPVLRVVRRITEAKAPTRIEVVTEFLGGVEATFVASDADLMISVLPPQTRGLEPVALPVIRAFLVAHRDHPLAQTRRVLRPEDVAEHVLLTVRGSDPRLQLSTVGLEHRSTVRLNDFNAKKAAIVANMGFGWMPEYLVRSELRRGVLKRLRWSQGDTHVFEPRLHHRGATRLGRAAREVLAALGSSPRPMASDRPSTKGRRVPRRDAR